MYEHLKNDNEIYEVLQLETERQQNKLELIASENFVSPAVLEAAGSVLTNKYAEGYPGKRYYGGCEYVDKAENIARDRLKELFDAEYVNVQPHSGSQANMAVFMTLLKPGDKFIGLSLAHGGHLTHGSAVNFSGKLYQAVGYELNKTTKQLDYNIIEDMAIKEKPKMIVAGASAYSREWDYEKLRQIADSIGALLMCDMAHPAGLIAKGLLNDPIPHCDVVTSTTHKTLRGPRGGIILAGANLVMKNEDIAKKLNSAIFPGSQGGPLMHVIAAKAVAFAEALRPKFRAYSHAVVENARVLAAELGNGGCDIVAGGTDTHLMLVDLRPKGLTGRAAEASLERAGMTCNKNAIPFDPEKPSVTSGVRLGTPAGTTRGFGVAEFRLIGQLICEVLDGLASNPDDNNTIETAARRKVEELCRRFPIYNGF